MRFGRWQEVVKRKRGRKGRGAEAEWGSKGKLDKKGDGMGRGRKREQCRKGGREQRSTGVEENEESRKDKGAVQRGEGGIEGGKKRLRREKRDR